MSDGAVCGSTDTDTGDPCQFPVAEADERCHMHPPDGGGPPPGHGSGTTEQNALATEGGAPDGNGNAETHGLTAEREAWFERHREDAEPIVRALVESYVADAPFGFENAAKVDLLTEVCIDQARLRQSNEVLDEFLTEQVVDVSEGGQPIYTIEEHPGHLPRARIKRDNIRILKELGILDDPASQQAAATHDLADAARQLADDRGEDIIDV